MSKLKGEKKGEGEDITIHEGGIGDKQKNKLMYAVVPSCALGSAFLDTFHCLVAVSLSAILLH